MKDSDEIEINAVFLGDTGVGKTSIINKYQSGQMKLTVSTVSSSYVTINEEINGRMFKLGLWDTPGQETYDSNTQFIFKNHMDAIVFVCDAERMDDTVDRVRDWLRKLNESFSEEINNKVCLFFACNKADKRKEQADLDMLENISKNEGVYEYNRVFHTSAETGLGIDELTKSICEVVYKRMIDNSAELPKADSKSKKNFLKIKDCNVY